MLHLTHCRWMENLAALERAGDLVDREHDPRLWDQIRVFTCNSLRWGPVPAGEAIARIEADEANGEVGAQARLGFTAALLAMQGRFDQARLRSGEASQFYVDRGMQLPLGGQAMQEQAIETLAGDFEAADRALSTGIEILKAVGETGVLSTLASMHAQVLYQLGRRDEMEAAIDLARQTGAPTDISTQANWRWVAAMAAADDGRMHEARALISEAIELMEPTDFPEMRAGAFEALAHVEAGSGDPEAWKAALERALAEHDRKGNLVAAKRVREQLAQGAP
jgi:tetratricopeptide (TPR) repeat protein